MMLERIRRQWRIVAPSLMVLSVGLATTTAAAQPPESSVELAAAQARLWTTLGAKTPGVYRAAGVVFSWAERPVTKATAAERIRAATEADALDQLARDAVGAVLPETGVADELLRRYVAKTLHFPGRTVVSECFSGYCRVVFAAEADDLAAAVRRVNTPATKKAAIDAFRNKPSDFPGFLAAAGFPDLELLLQVRQLGVGLYNVKTPFVPTDKTLAVLSDFARKRSSILAQFLQSSADDDRIERLAMMAMTAVNCPPAFKATLERAGIAWQDWKPLTPLLEQVARAQGYVRLDTVQSVSSRSVMAFVRKGFAEGKNLPLLLAVLENEAEAAPQMPDVWEYLAAGYWAAGRREAARICARVWFLLSERWQEPLLWQLKKFGRGAAADDLVRWLQSR